MNVFLLLILFTVEALILIPAEWASLIGFSTSRKQKVVRSVRSIVLIPEEIPSLLSIVYSNIPPVLKGTDSRLGIGFRLGPNADFQYQVELGPQTRTKPIGPEAPEPEASKKRHVNNQNQIGAIQSSFSSKDKPHWIYTWNHIKTNKNENNNNQNTNKYFDTEETNSMGNQYKYQDEPNQVQSHLNQLYKQSMLNKQINSDVNTKPENNSNDTKDQIIHQNIDLINILSQQNQQNSAESIQHTLQSMQNKIKSRLSQEQNKQSNLSNIPSIHTIKSNSKDNISNKQLDVSHNVNSKPHVNNKQEIISYEIPKKVKIQTSIEHIRVKENNEPSTNLRNTHEDKHSSRITNEKQNSHKFRNNENKNTGIETVQVVKDKYENSNEQTSESIQHENRVKITSQGLNGIQTVEDEENSSDMEDIPMQEELEDEDVNDQDVGESENHMNEIHSLTQSQFIQKIPGGIKI